uniref:Uncharacterized protein n=1 Tax=viral metagenome TaxID=1070528 RepID=A0A6C0JBM3_9ZZZZ
MLGITKHPQQDFFFIKIFMSCVLFKLILN